MPTLFVPVHHSTSRLIHISINGIWSNMLTFSSSNCEEPQCWAIQTCLRTSSWRHHPLNICWWLSQHSTKLLWAKQVLIINKEAGFNLRSFVSNSKEVLTKLPAAIVKEDCSNESLNMESNAITENYSECFGTQKTIHDEQKQSRCKTIWHNKKPSEGGSAENGNAGLWSKSTVIIIHRKSKRSVTEWDRVISLELNKKMDYVVPVAIKAGKYKTPKMPTICIRSCWRNSYTYQSRRMETWFNKRERCWCCYQVA